MAKSRSVIDSDNARHFRQIYIYIHAMSWIESILVARQRERAVIRIIIYIRINDMDITA